MQATISDPRQLFADKLTALSDDTLVLEMESWIFLAAYAAMDPQADPHWKVDACYEETLRRGKHRLYVRAFNLASEAV